MKSARRFRQIVVRPLLLFTLSTSAGAAEANWLASVGPPWISGALLVGLGLFVLRRAHRLFGPASERWRRKLTIRHAELGGFEYQPTRQTLRCAPEALTQLLGLDASWHTAPVERWRERLHPDDVDYACQTALQLDWTPGAEHHYTLRVLHAAGHWEWLALDLVVPTFSGRRPPLYGVFRLVSRQLQTEHSLQRSEHAFQLLADHSQDVIARFGLDFRCLSVNPAVQRVSGHAPADLIGQPISARGWGQDVIARFENACSHLIDTRQPGRLELELMQADHQQVLDIRLYPELDNDDQVASILCFERDVSEARQIQRLWEQENLVLEMVANTRPLADVLNQLCSMIEAQLQHGWCAVMLLDKQGERLNLAAAPTLPTGFLKTLDGMAIGPNQITSGSAAYWRRTVMVDDVETSPLWTEYKDLARAFGIRAAWAVPIMTDDQHLLGTLAIYYPEKRSPSPDEMQLAYRSSHIAAIAIERDKHEKRLYHEATRDVLTNGFNRRHFLELGMRELKRARRYEMPLALLMLDLDHFKAINDTYGHQSGNEALRQFSSLAHRTLRGSDMLGRLGGEEFAVMLPATHLNEAMLMAERLRRIVEQNTIEWMGKPLHCTVSIGVAVLEPTDSNVDEILVRADHALRLAKTRGRNRVVSMPESGAPAQLAS